MIRQTRNIFRWKFVSSLVLGLATVCAGLPSASAQGSAAVVIVEEFGEHELLTPETVVLVMERDDQVHFEIRKGRYLLAFSEPWMAPGSNWLFYQEVPDEMWIFAGGEDIVRLSFGEMDFRVEHYEENPDLLEQAPLGFLERLVRD